MSQFFANVNFICVKEKKSNVKKRKKEILENNRACVNHKLVFIIKDFFLIKDLMPNLTTKAVNDVARLTFRTCQLDYYVLFFY